MAGKTDWVEIARRGRNHAVLIIFQVMEAHVRGYPQKTLGFDLRFNSYRQFDGARWVARKDLEDYVNGLKEKEEENPGFLLELAERCERMLDEIKSKTQVLQGVSYESMGGSEVAVKFGEFNYLMLELFGTAYHYTAINKFYPDLFEAKIAAKVPDLQTRNAYLKHLFAVEEPTGMRREKVSLARIAAMLRQKGMDLEDEEIRQELQEHAGQYAYLGFYLYYGTPYEGEVLKKRLSEQAEKNEEIEIESQIEFDKKKTQEIIELLNLDAETVRMIETIKKWSFLANELDESYALIIYKNRGLFEKIGELLGLTYDEIIEMTLPELVDALEKGEKASGDLKQRLHKRYEDHAIVLEDGRITLFEGDAFEKYRAQEARLDESFYHLSELKGQCASPGLAKGTVKVINGIHDLEKVKKGDVLVAASTVPAFVPAMEKAVAIVTDEGGLLSHAAIVSRELGVPCVVGTKIATKALKDGEMVEVDATNGIVKKLL